MPSTPTVPAARPRARAGVALVALVVSLALLASTVSAAATGPGAGRLAGASLPVPAAAGTPVVADAGLEPDPTSPLDCEGPAPDAEPDTTQWFARDAHNMACALQRHADKATHPTTALPATGPPYDAYREPTRHDGVRFRFDETTVAGLDVEVYRPCDAASCPELPADLSPVEAPYPAVISFHGGASRKELHWWSSQPLAEAGYLVVSYDAEGTSPTQQEAGLLLDWLFDRDDPLTADFDGRRVGVAGHSAGGVLVSAFGQTDPRVDAIVSWDRAQSSPLPEGLELDTPALFMFADYNCQQVPVCKPEPYPSPPDPDGPGNKGRDFELARDAGIDTMQIALRAATHLDWTPSMLAASRYGELVSVYYTLAWFDRHVRGLGNPHVASDGHRRLVAEVFDDSADRHNLSQGHFDPVRAVMAGDPYAGNVPYTLEGQPVADRLSFYFRSKCHLSTPPGRGGQRLHSEDLRADGCDHGPRGGMPRRP